MPAIRRTAARVLLVDWAYRVLLLHATDPAEPERGTWWELPGGGVKRGEDSAAACVRELAEETGIATGVRVGPCVWVRDTTFRFAGLRFEQRERIHVAWLDQPDAPRAATALEALERGAFLGDRWWTLDELAGSDAVFVPSRLPALAGPVVRGEYGATPVDAGE